MIVAGANRHAKEVFDILYQKNEMEDLYFFDDVSEIIEEKLFKKYPIIRSLNEAKNIFRNNPNFVLGLGNPYYRNKVSEKFCSVGGILTSIISNTTSIGHFEVKLGDGLNIMHYSMVSNCATIGTGTLINAFVSVHHDVSIGQYCEVSPHVALLGGCTIGDFCSIGSNATVLPNVKIGDHVIVGAGAVVTKDLPAYSVAVGAPAKIIKYHEGIS